MVSRWRLRASVCSIIKPMDDFQNILENGDDGKVKTKAKKKQYITGAHGSGSARQKAKYREQRANRHKK